VCVCVQRVARVQRAAHLRACVCVCVYACEHACVCVSMCVYVCVYMCACSHSRLCRDHDGWEAGQRAESTVCGEYQHSHTHTPQRGHICPSKACPSQPLMPSIMVSSRRYTGGQGSAGTVLMWCRHQWLPWSPLTGTKAAGSHLVAAHAGHHDVQQDDVREHLHLLQHVQRLLPIHGLGDLWHH